MDISRSLAEFKPKNYKVIHNLTENLNSQQNTANLNISLVFGLPGVIFFNIWLGSLKLSLSVSVWLIGVSVCLWLTGAERLSVCLSVADWC